MQETLYQILDVEEDATSEQLRTAYRRQAMKWHPDRNPDNRQASETRFKQISSAYRTLVDPIKRAEYDQELAYLRRHTQSSPGNRFGQDDADISEEEAAKLFFELMLDIAFELAKQGHDDQVIYKELIRMGCPDPIARAVAVMAVKHAGVTNGGGANTTESRTQAKTGRAENNPARPWMRFFARNIDLALFSILGYLAIAFIYPKLLGKDEVGKILIVPFAFAWVFVEAWLLSKYGTTPGKFLLNTKINLASGAIINYDKALSRSIKAWWRGLGAGLPLISSITCFISYNRLKRKGITTWDMEDGFIVTHGRVGNVQGALAIIFLSSLVIFSVALREQEVDQPGFVGTPAYEIPQKTEVSYHPNPNPNPNPLDPYEEMGKLYRSKSYSELLVEANKILSINPGDMLAMNFGGLAFQGLGDIENARRYFSNALNIKNSDPVLLFNLSLTYNSSSEIPIAIGLLQKALQLDPYNQEVSSRLQYLQDGLQKSVAEVINARRVKEEKPVNSNYGYVNGNKTPSHSRVRNINGGVVEKEAPPIMESKDSSSRASKYAYANFASMAALGTSEEIILAIQHGANVNESTSVGTPLTAATQYNRVDVVKMLIQNGADIEGKDRFGKTAMIYAKLKANGEMIELLTQNGAINPFVR